MLKIRKSKAQRIARRKGRKRKPHIDYGMKFWGIPSKRFMKIDVMPMVEQITIAEDRRLIEMLRSASIWEKAPDGETSLSLKAQSYEA
jgi:hypothetical protein